MRNKQSRTFTHAHSRMVVHMHLRQRTHPRTHVHIHSLPLASAGPCCCHSSENYLVVGGRDRLQNEALVRRHLRESACACVRVCVSVPVCACLSFYLLSVRFSIYFWPCTRCCCCLAACCELAILCPLDPIAVLGLTMCARAARHCFVPQTTRLCMQICVDPAALL